MGRTDQTAHPPPADPGADPAAGSVETTASILDSTDAAVPRTGTGPTDAAVPRTGTAEATDSDGPVGSAPESDPQASREPDSGDLAAQVRRVAREIYGLGDLRPGQLEAVVALAGGRDALVVMPTGSGKSAIYQVAAQLLPGPTVVVSPLIALQNDQVLGLRTNSDAGGAVTTNSHKSERQRTAAVNAVRQGHVEFLFLSPEQLANTEVLEAVRAAGPSLIAVDEAHCVSQWGHDFRPDYLRLDGVIAAFGHPPVAALTATAAPPVRSEIVERLGLRDPAEVVLGFDRPNIFLAVETHGDDGTKREAVLDRAVREHHPGILYAARRKDAEAYARTLAEHGLRAAAYHAGLRKDRREEVQKAFMSGDLDVVAATSAFGMGIDKADVRFVLHADIPESIDAYYQQIGRCGRDGAPSLGVLFYRPGDTGLQRFFVSGVPAEEDVSRIAEILWRVPDLDRRELHEVTRLPLRRLTRIRNLLDDAWGENVHSAAELAERAMAIAHDQRNVRRSQLEMMRGYAETHGCRRQFLLGYFGEIYPEVCGHCDTCEGGTAEEQPAPEETPFPAGRPVRHREWGEGTVVRVEEDRIVVLFEQVGYKELLLSVVADAEVLERA